MAVEGEIGLSETIADQVRIEFTKMIFAATALVHRQSYDYT